MKKQRYFRISLGWRILIGIGLGLVVGRFFYHDQTAISILQSIGTLFINLIKMIVLPIVVSCLVVGIAKMGDIKKLGRIGGKTLLYFEVMTTFAIILGLAVGNITKPGALIDIHSLAHGSISQYTAAAKTAGNHGLGDIIMDIVPTNFFAALGSGEMIPVIFFTVMFGLGLATFGKKATPLIDAFEMISEVMFKMTNWIMQLAPIGVFALIGVTIAQFGFEALKPLLYFIIVCYATMAFFVVVVAGLVARIWHINIFEILKVFKEELVLAFSTASSEAALPKVMEKVQNYGVSQGIASFVIPTGYSFNLDGSAIYQSLAALFLAQAYHIHLSLTQQITLLVVLMITSKGMAGVPGASFVVLLATITTIGVPAAGVAFIAGIDRIVDMGRTAVNVMGNSLAAVIIAKSENEFDEQKHQQYMSGNELK
ncbi:dicarboxylate/amino acid:cation symporter [Latilactobacillus curvatus]|uniref:Glutamate/aspartate:proton symporter GltP n=2 Tax=Bacilli TaxID=91061 RepID=A0A385AGE9_LATCU|nr:cation:dicarboxylase symporter family transporter [Latilactobacillus curvatus]AXN36396.1 glutamate/aspartate:proton symporter GltP [Latilactobacillus curvatus]MCT1216324.1 glutamate/aspartate:proton symporter GltP [Latilactobacillus curvatus]MCT3533295.1 glutamate/aspartate:proton symporter GltP [Latilactobacillus curvatus]MDG2977971.1 cation:dicarboxylase symporter family transporter [Latilactobacillus curvatus]UTB71736.1 glutamate/aspartate:proton symporter GltP [Latilactobacillus curvatu